MAKRILSLVLTCALLLGCISGLTLISSAASTVNAANLSPDTYDGGQGAIFKGEFDGFNVFGWQKTGWASWNNAKVANALGIAHGTVVDTLTYSLDYYWDKGETDSDNNWWHFKTTNEDGSGTEGDGFSTLLNQGMTAGAWSEVTITREKQKLGAGDDLFINFGDLNNSKFYVRGMKAVATVGEDTYTALWGSYLTASIDFKSGTPVLKNMTGLDKRGDAAQTADVEAIGETGLYGVKLGISNSGIKFFLENMPAFTEPMAVSVEYYMDSTVIDNNSRINFRVENGDRQSYVLRKGMYSGADVVNEDKDLVADKAGLYTFVLSDANALEKLHGELGFIWWGGKTGDYAHILSISIFPASQLNAIEDPGYDYIDFTNEVVTNPYYPSYKEADIVGMKWTLNGTEGNGTVTENGMEMTSGTLYIDSARARGKSPIGVKVYFAEGTTGNFTFQYNADPEKVADNPNYTGVNPEIGEDGVAAFILDNAKFDGKQNAGCSARMYADGKTIERIEIYTMADKTALNEAIAKEVSFEGKTSASIAAYNAAKEAAQAVADNAWAIESEINNALAALTAAEAGLKDIREVTFGDRLGHVEFDHFEGEYKDEGANIGFTDQGEWFEYEINVKEEALYNINIEMATGNADSTIEVQDGNGKVYGSFVVPQADWGTYNTYTVTAPLAAGVQKLRIVYKQSSANYRGLTLTDARYTLTNATWLPTFTETTNAHYGMIEKKDGRYAWHIQHNKGLAIGFANGYEALKDVTSVTIEMDYWLESNEAFTGNTGENGIGNANNRRFLLKVGGSDVVNDAGVGDAKNTFNMGSIATLGGGFDGWSTVKFEMTDVDMTQTFWSAASLRLMFYDEGSDTAEEGPGCYISGFRVYATEDPSKIIAISFTETANKSALKAEVDAAITDLSTYTSSTAAAYTAALEAAQAVLAEDAEQDAIDAALANLVAAKEALTPVYTLNNVTGFQSWCSGTIVKYDGSYAWLFDPTGNNKGLSLGGYNGILNESSTVIYEVVAQFEQNANNFHLWYGTNGEQKNDNFACVEEAVGNWYTYTLTVENFDASKCYADTPLTIFGHPGDQGNKLYVRSFKAYDAEDPTKEVSLVFATYPSKNDLEDALENAVNTGSYTAASVEAYNAALAAIEELLAKDEVTEDEVVAALAALKAAEEALVPAYSNMTFENDEIHNVNSNITHNHPDEDDEGNGIFEIYENAGIYGIKLSKQNRGFGYAVQNAANWLTEGEPVQITVTYYAPSAVINDNSRIGISFSGDSWYRVRFGANADFAASGLVADEVSSFTITLSEADAAKILANESFNFYFWNHNDNAETGGDYIYLTEIRVHNPLPADKEDLQAAVDAAIEDLSGYTDATASAYTAAIEAAKAVLANEEATAADIEKAIKDIMAAEAALEERIYDVIVVDISTTQGDNPKIGDKVYFTFTVKNNGEETIPAGSKYGGIVKIGDTLIGWSDHYKGVDVAPALAPGETLVLTLCGGPSENPTGVWVVTEGAVEVFAQVNDNPGDGINETITDNNTFTKTITPCNLYFEDLVQAIAEEITDLTPYTEDSAAAYTAALEAAKALIGNLETTQEAIDAALEALEDAALGLVEKGDEPTPVGKAGDVDKDGEITSTDARLVLQYYAEKITDADLDLTVADVDGDKEITSTDARLILQLYAGKIDAFPTPAE